jgi:SSS family transporter
MASAGKFLSVADWAVIAAYLVGVIALGVWFGKEQRNTRDYFLGSKNVPWWGIGLSIVAAETSALTIIGVPAMAYGENFLFIQMIIGYVIARVILAVVMVPHYFKGEIYSPYQLFANSFGPAARQAAGGMFLLSETLAAGVRVYVASIPIQLMLGKKALGAITVLPWMLWRVIKGQSLPPELTGDPILGAIVLFVVLSLVYTYIGGVKAVIWTDAVQFGLFLAGGLFTIGYIPCLMDGGVAGVLREASAGGKLVWLNTNWAAVEKAGFGEFFRACLAKPFNLWMGIIGGTVMVMSSHGAEQLIVQRVLSCKSVADGRKALMLSAILIIPLFFIFLLAGVMLWVYYQHHALAIPIPEARPGSGIQANDFIFPIFILTEVPHWLRGFLIVAILAAAMSSVSSALTSLASVSTMDFLRHLVREKAEEFYLRFSKYSTVLWAVALVLVAYLSREVAFVLNMAFSLRGLTSGALLGGLLLAVCWKRGRAMPVVGGMAAGLATMTAIQVLPKLAWSKPFWQTLVGVEIFWPWYALIGAVVTIAVAWLLRRLLPAALDAQSGDLRQDFLS